MKIEVFLKKDKVTRLPIREPLLVSPEMPVGEVIIAMKEKRGGCVLIEERGGLVGIFTERDVLKKVVVLGASLSAPIREFMSRQPKTVKGNQSVASVIKLMADKRYRNLPVVDNEGRVLGTLNIKDVVRYLANFFPCEVYNLPPDPKQIALEPEGA